jgi:membrane protease YdiL (CAAX protease family)
MKNDVSASDHVGPTIASAPGVGGTPAAASGLARHPLMIFTVLTLVLSWLPIIPYALGLFPGPLLACGPFLAAIITAAVVGGRKGLRAYFRQLIRWRVGVGWYVVALLAPVAGWALIAYVNVLLGAAPPSPVQLAGWPLVGTATLIFLINPLGGAWEEPGWRGYALPLLLRRHSALVASAVLGVIWTLWHVPLFLTGHVPWPDAAAVFALSFVFTAIYLRTAGSVPIAFLLHASINGAAEFFVALFSGGDRMRMYWILVVFCAVVVVIANAVGRDRWRRVPALASSDDAAIDGSGGDGGHGTTASRRAAS